MRCVKKREMCFIAWLRSAGEERVSVVDTIVFTIGSEHLVMYINLRYHCLHELLLSI